MTFVTVHEPIDASGLRRRLDGGEPVTVLSGRTPDEVAALPVGGPSVRTLRTLPLHALRHPTISLSSERETVVCAAGVRTYEAVRTLCGAGFWNVQFLEGGLEMTSPRAASSGGSVHGATTETRRSLPLARRVGPCL